MGKGEFAVLEAFLKVVGINGYHDEINPDLIRQITGQGQKALGSLLLTVAEHITDLHNLAFSFSLASGNGNESCERYDQPDYAINPHGYFLLYLR
jgi:hypothetical protein